MQRKSKWPRNVAETILSSASQNLEGKNGTPSKATPRALPKERASTVERARGYSVGAVQGKAVTSALNAPTNVLVTLMGKRPLNSVASVTATNRKWGRAADGTSIRVVTYLINRWKVRINWEGLCNIRIHPRQKGGDDVSSLGQLKPSIKGVIRTLNSSDEVQGLELPRPCREESLLGYAQFTPVWSSWTPWLTTVRSPRSSFLAHSLQIYCLGL